MDLASDPMVGLTERAPDRLYVIWDHLVQGDQLRVLGFVRGRLDGAGSNDAEISSVDFVLVCPLIELGVVEELPIRDQSRFWSNQRVVVRKFGRLSLEEQSGRIVLLGRGREGGYFGE